MAGREQGARQSLRAGKAARAGAAAAWQSRFVFGLATASRSGSPARRTGTSLSFDEVGGGALRFPFRKKETDDDSRAAAATAAELGKSSVFLRDTCPSRRVTSVGAVSPAKATD